MPMHSDASSLEFRPPAVPLVTHDPYFSGWSFTDQLHGSETRHWTGAHYGLSSLIRIDGTVFRIMGATPHDVPVLAQSRVTVLPTRTVYEFEGAGVAVTLTFLSPLLPDDLRILARPVTYVTWSVRSTDSQPHDVSVYFHATGEWAVDRPGESVVSSRFRVPGLEVIRIGSQLQPVLAKVGDDLRIDWGYLYLAISGSQGGSTALASSWDAQGSFRATGSVPAADAIAPAEPVRSRWPVLAASLALGNVGNEPVSRSVMLAYDDLYSLELFHRRLRPYWTLEAEKIQDILLASAADYDGLSKRCQEFDTQLVEDLTRIGGDRYAQVAALSFRQAISAHKLAVDYDGSPVFFSKENFSNGCIDTVDVTYPSSPFFLLFNPDLLKAQLTAILDYAQSPHWKFPFAPHDLGTYPLANGQVYGGGERTEDDQMPVEECGNMLILVAAYVRSTGDTTYADRYWSLITQWADYLREKGLDPENQLCTDDFAGHLAHNVNLSLKAILGIGAYAGLCRLTGRLESADTYRGIAQAMADEWRSMADAGDHYRLTFDGPDTWSQKYNLVWDTLLDLSLFPKEVAAREVAFYLTKQNAFGLPLDSRSDQTKLDWIVWSATLAESREDFEALVAPIFRFAHESPSRVPLTDWYDSVTAKQIGFQARSVVGGVFIKLLAEKWKRDA